MAVVPSASYRLTVRLEIKNRPGMLGRVASAIGETGGDIGAVELVESQRDCVVRDITIKARDSVHGQRIVNRLRQVSGVRITNVIIPSVFNKAVAPAVAEGVARTAHQTGVARRRRRREVAPVW